MRQGTSVNWVSAPVYGNFAQTSDFVKDALNQDIPTKVLLWDNGSPERDLEAYVADSRVYIVRSTENIGVGPAWNRICGMLFGGLLEPPTDKILICNTDIRLRPDTYRNLLIPNGGFVTPINVGDWEKAQKADFLVEPEPYSKGGPDFSCFLLHQDFYNSVGLFDECFLPAFFEDNSYHWRARCAGLDSKIYSVTFPYYHIGSQTLKNNPEIAVINSTSFEKNKQLYISMWGGEPGRETHRTPYGL